MWNSVLSPLSSGHLPSPKERRDILDNFFVRKSKVAILPERGVGVRTFCRLNKKEQLAPRILELGN
jgi:hypothetical protein